MDSGKFTNRQEQGFQKSYWRFTSGVISSTFKIPTVICMNQACFQAHPINSTSSGTPVLSEKYFSREIGSLCQISRANPIKEVMSETI